MPNILHNDMQLLRIYLIHNAVVPDTQAVQTFSALQLC